MKRFLSPVLLLFVLIACDVVQAVSPTPTPTLSEYTTYTVQPGDTLGQVATRYHVTIERLIALNTDRYPTLARDPSILQAGWTLRVPTRGVAARPTEAAAPQADLSQVARQIIVDVNAARAQRGLSLLRADATLTRIAGDRSADMIARDYFSHYDPQTGQEPLLRYLQANSFSYRYAGENIAEIKNDAGWVPPWLAVAARYSTTDLVNEFVKGWLNSPEHRANIHDARYRRTGVALAVSQDGRRIVASQVFAD